MNRKPEMKNPLETMCRMLFWLFSVVGFGLILYGLAGVLGDYKVLVIFLVPFWFTGAYAIIQELRRARGKRLPRRSLLKDAPLD